MYTMKWDVVLLKRYIKNVLKKNSKTEIFHSYLSKALQN